MQLAYHQSSMTKMTAFKESCSNPTHNVASMLNIECKEQGISLHGHRDDSTASESVNTVNFIQLVQFRAKNDDVLRIYLETAPRNALYTSKIMLF